MYDVVVFETDAPGGVSLKGRKFQTKGLDCSLDRYTVTAEGRLCLTGSEWFDEEPAAADEDAIDIEYHGDIRVVPEKGEGEYLARFTHGTLEWVRPITEEDYEKVARRYRRKSDAAG